MICMGCVCGPGAQSQRGAQRDARQPGGARLARGQRWGPDGGATHPRSQPATARRNIIRWRRARAGWERNHVGKQTIVASGKSVTQFRDYDNALPRVEAFYAANHKHQTLDFVLEKKREYLSLNRKTFTVWEALEFLNSLVDDSDPDVDFTQIEHALQTAESIRAADQPRWFIVTGWSTTSARSCASSASRSGRSSATRSRSAAAGRPRLSTATSSARIPTGSCPSIRPRTGSTSPAAASTTSTCRGATTSTSTTRSRGSCPDEALYMLRYHSFYPWHKEEEYSHLLERQGPLDAEVGAGVQPLRPVSKGSARPNVEELMPYYEELDEGVLPRAAPLVGAPVARL